jgi:hypothetical protein
MTTLVAVVGVLLVLAVLLAAINLIMRRRGYSIPGKSVVRCSKGHLFTTSWIEGGSFRAIKLGPRSRFQHCPVGDHWAIVHPVRDEELTDEDRRALAIGTEG